jgi:hypothetical protein
MSLTSIVLQRQDWLRYESPATQDVAAYKVRITGDAVEIEI